MGEMHINNILEGLERYLKTIVCVKSIYCQQLMMFLGINPKSMEPFDSDDEGRYSDLSSN